MMSVSSTTTAAISANVSAAAGTSSATDPTNSNNGRRVNLQSSQSLFSCIYPMISFDVVLWPARNKRLLISQLASITEFYRLPIASTYCEIIRSCIVGLVDATGTTDHAKWAVFIFLKMPPLLRELGFYYYSERTTPGCAQTPEQAINLYALDLKQAIGRLLCYTPLIDLADYKCNCDFLDSIIQELCKPIDGESTQVLIQNLQPLAQQRKEASKASGFVAATAGQGPGLFKILQAEPTLLTILLDVSDQGRKDDANDKYVRILCQLVNGKSFELSLAAAAATGHLHELTRRLIEINETSSPTNSLLFDITFLILAHIGHHYGVEALETTADDQTGTNSYFVRWFLRCYNHETMISCPKLMLMTYAHDVNKTQEERDKEQKSATEKTDYLIDQLLESTLDPKFTLQLVPGKLDTWQEVSTYMPAAIKELLDAWQANLLDETLIKTMIERMKSRMCCLALIVAAWLRVYIKTLGDGKRTKPMLLMQELQRSSSLSRGSFSAQNPSLTSSVVAGNEIENQSSVEQKFDPSLSLIPVAASTSATDDNKTTANEDSAVDSAATATSTTMSSTSTSTVNVDSHRERASLMSHLIKKMHLELQPKTTSINGSRLQNYSDSLPLNLVNNNNSESKNIQAINRRLYNINIPARDLLDAQLVPSFERGWLSVRAVHNINALLRHVCSPEWLVDNVCARVLRHESPSDLSQSVDLALGIFHLDIRACAHALVTHTIFNYLACTSHSMMMMQPRANALARLTVIALACADHETRTTSISRRSRGASGATDNNKTIKIKHEPMDVDQVATNPPTIMDQNDCVNKIPDDNELWNIKLNAAVRQLVGLLRSILDAPRMSQRTLFPVCFIQQMTECGNVCNVELLKRHVGIEMIEAARNINDSSGSNSMFQHLDVGISQAVGA